MLILQNKRFPQLNEGVFIYNPYIIYRKVKSVIHNYGNLTYILLYYFDLP